MSETAPDNTSQTRADAGPWEGAGRQGVTALYVLSFLSAAVAIGSVAWVSNGATLYAALIAVAAIGHVFSNIMARRRVRLGVVIYLAVSVVAVAMRYELLGVLTGGSLFPLAKLLAIVQALVSFNIRSLRSLYDYFLLSLAIILLVSESALSVQFALFLVLFAVVALAFLAAAHEVGESRNRQLIGSARLLGLGLPVLGTIVLTFGAAFLIFLALPQAHRVQAAAPLPSRLDLTVGRPPAPSETAGDSSPPAAGVLPSRDEASPESGTGGSIDPTQTGSPEAGSSAPTATPDTNLDASLTEYVPLGYTGPEEKDVVMYVRSPLASYWRGGVLDEYDGRGWVASDGGELQLEVDRYGRLRFKDAPSQSPEGRYVHSFFPRVSQPDAIFTGYSPGYVGFQDIFREGNATARAIENERRLREADSYRVVSSVPALTPEALVRDSVDSRYLATVSDAIVPERVLTLANEIVDGAPSEFHAAARLEQYLLTNYSYDLRVPPLTRSSDAVDSFLFERRSGYCAQFATAMAVMARAVDLPARVAIGYVPGEFNSLTGAHTVRLQDAHAWVEIKFNRHGWVPFDPTPRPDSPWALDPGYTQATRSLQEVLRSQVRGVFLDAPAAAVGALTSFIAVPLAAGLLFAAIVAVGLGVALLVARYRAVALRDRSVAYTLLEGRSRDEVRKLYRKAVRTLEKKGFPPRESYESPEDYVARLEDSDVAVPDAFRRISNLAGRALYDPAPLDDGVSEEGVRLLPELRVTPKLDSLAKTRFEEVPAL